MLVTTEIRSGEAGQGGETKLRDDQIMERPSCGIIQSK